VFGTVSPNFEVERAATVANCDALLIILVVE